MDVYEVVRKLIGPIDPVGETREDERRFENLKKMCELMDQIHTDIDDVVTYNKNRVEYSMKKAGEFADKFLTETIGIKE